MFNIKPEKTGGFLEIGAKKTGVYFIHFYKKDPSETAGVLVSIYETKLNEMMEALKNHQEVIFKFDGWLDTQLYGQEKALAKVFGVLNPTITIQITKTKFIVKLNLRIMNSISLDDASMFRYQVIRKIEKVLNLNQ